MAKKDSSKPTRPATRNGQDPLERAPTGSGQASLPDQIADRLITRIFTGALKPGDRLPPERTLAEQMAVDRTSLRMALGILKRMNLVSVLQGSGIVVQDYEQHAGLDFLAALFGIEEVSGRASLLLQVIDWANVNLPPILGMAAARATPAGLLQQEALYGVLADCGADVERATELAVLAQDQVAADLGNVIVTLTFNSTRRLRRGLLRMVIENVGPAVYAAEQLHIIRQLIAGRITAADVEAAYRDYLPTVTDSVRAALADGRA